MEWTALTNGAAPLLPLSQIPASAGRLRRALSVSHGHEPRWQGEHRFSEPLRPKCCGRFGQGATVHQQRSLCFC
jgi:hypothetical protein